MAHNIATSAGRKKLPVKNEPYWHRLARGKFVGFRRAEENRGSWRAWNREAGDRTLLGDETSLDFEAASKKAWAFFEEMDKPALADTRVRDVVSDYLTFLHNERAASSYSTTKSRADRHIFPYPLANLRVGDITTEKIQAWLGKVAGSSQDPEQRRKNLYSANKLLVILKAALNRAHAKNRSLPAEEWRAVKPFKGGVSIGRKVFLTEAESQRLVNCCDPEFRDLVIFGLLTGCRLGEAVQMKVRDFDQRLGVWDVRVSKTGERTCTLTGAAIDLLERLVAGKPKSSLVFVRDSGEAWNKDNVQPPMRHAVKRAELDKATSYYSLRHTAISASLVAGTVPQIVAENVGTSLRMIEQHYGKFARADRRAALERGALHLELPETNVVNIG